MCTSRKNCPFRIKLAGQVIEVEPFTDSLASFCRDYVVSDFAIEPDFRIEITRSDIENERSLANDINLTVKKTGVGDVAAFEMLDLARKVADGLLNFDTVLFHGSCIALDGRACCFAAPSGVGKSTHAALWKKHFRDRVTYVNDDKPFIKITEDGIFAFGSPWRGAHQLGENTSAPLSAICLLRRGATNQIEPVTADEAFPYIFAQTHRPRGEGAMSKLLPLVGKLTERVKLFSLGCNTDPEAAVVAFEGMRKEGAL